MHCSFIKCSLKDLYSGTSVTKKECSGRYEISEIQRIRLSSNTDREGFYELLYMATNTNTAYPTNFGFQTNFSIVSNSTTKGNGSNHCNEQERNTVHHVQVNGISNPRVQRHCISKLQNISHMKYSLRHPMVLWAAAREPTNSSLYIGKGSHRRPMMGYGNSLYSIDLRCNQSSFMWSPSQKEFMMDNIHSISGLLVDPSQPYSVYAKSLTSGGRLYEIDTRMPRQTIFAWDLPGLCDDFTASLSPLGIYGSSALMCRPTNFVDSTTQLPIICANQNPGGYGIQLYQRPSRMPRFQTDCLDMPMTTGLGSGNNLGHESDNTCFATSTSFPLSESVPLCGLASFYTNLSSVYDESNTIMDYKECPPKALCIISATIAGDLYSHTLLVTSGNEERRERIIEGKRVGSCAVDIPHVPTNVLSETKLKYSTEAKDMNLRWLLGNRSPVDSQSILKHHVASRSQCRQFETVDLQDIPQRKSKSKRTTTTDHDISLLNHPLSETYMGNSDKKKTSALKIKAQYIRDAELSLDGHDLRNDSVEQDYSNKDAKIDLTMNNIQRLKELW